MALQPLIEWINAFSISILISILGVDRSIVLDQQKQIDRSKSISISNRSRQVCYFHRFLIFGLLADLLKIENSKNISSHFLLIFAFIPPTT
jgi:hypothetical protein